MKEYDTAGLLKGNQKLIISLWPRRHSITTKAPCVNCIGKQLKTKTNRFR